MNAKNIFFYLKWILATVLIAAGILKIFQPENLVEVILFFGLLSEQYAFVFVYGIAFIEIILALLLVIQYKPKITNSLVLGLCACFLAIAVVGYLDDWKFACGCLGRFSFGSFDGLMVLRNTILLGMAGWIALKSQKRNETLSRE